jgi:signal transduction histidine kinase
VLLSAVAIAAMMLFQERSNDSRDARTRLAEVQSTLNALQTAPFQANASTGGSPGLARILMSGERTRVEETLEGLQGTWAPPELDAIQEPLRADYRTLQAIYRLGITVGYNQDADRLAGISRGQFEQVATLLNNASAKYEERAERATVTSFVASGVAIIGLLAAFAFLYRRVVRARAAQDTAQRALRLTLAQLEQAQHERAQLLARTVEIAEHERMRVAGDLHDGPIQRLTAVAFDLDRLAWTVDGVDAEQVNALAADIRIDVAEVMGELRRLMIELRPPVLDEGGLEAALRDSAGEILESTVAYSVRGALEGVVAAPEVETVVYRVAREALANVRKHAEATKVDVALTTRAGTLCLTVADDGRGFEVEEVSGGRAMQLGLIGMRERVESVGGQLLVFSTIGSGTRIEARLPLRPRVESRVLAAA